MDEHLQDSPNPDQISDRLASSILAEIHKRYALDLSQDPAALERIRKAALDAVQALDSNPETEIDLPFISANSRGPIHYSRRLTREDLGLAPGSVVGAEGDSPTPSTEEKPKMVRVKLPAEKPVVTITLMVIMILVYLTQILTQYAFNQDIPAALGMKVNEAILAGQYWRLFTAMFLHGGILHIGFNLYALYILGREVERFFGPWRFLGLFLVSGFAGNLFSFFFTTSPSLGSSTAIFGLLSAEGVFIYQHRKLFGERFRRALRQIIEVGAINLLIGLSPGIDNWGHLGGLLGGLAFAWFGGPILELEGEGSLMRLRDSRPAGKSWPVLLVELIILAGLAAWVIYQRS